MTPSSFPRRLAPLLVGALALAAGACGWQGTAVHSRGAGRTADGSAPDPLTVTLRPENGITVGVGMPVILRLSADVAPQQRDGFLEHVHVTSVPAARGAWHWFAPNEVHWRPATYWTPGTRVEVTADLDGFATGAGRVAEGTWWSTFTVGERHLSVIDTVRHRMRVYDGTRLVHTWPLSAGRPDLPTISGVLYIRYKDQDVLMDSESIGIPREEWDGYNEHVFWDTAISTDGYYIHGAPWSLKSQGVTNVSHGCINLSSEHAEAFYTFSNVGDLVVVHGSKRLATADDGEGDWQMPFVDYARRSTVPRTVF